MSVERSNNAVSPKAVAGAAGHSGKGKATSGEEADALAVGGFLALLNSLELEVEVGVAGAGTGEQIGAADARLSAEETPHIAIPPTAEPLILVSPNLPTDLSMLLAQAGQIAGDKLNTASDEQSTEMKGRIRLTAPAMPAVKPEMAVAASTPLGAERSGDFTQHVDALLEHAAQALPIGNIKARRAELQSGAAASLAESRALKLSSLVDVSGRESSFSGAMVSSGIGDSFARQVDQAVVRPLALLAGYGMEGSWGHNAFQAGSRVDAAPVMADPSLQSMVADTVSYWVTQGVQNAELKLDGFGGQSVAVSISLKGDEAHIGFRTDQPEIRQMLEGAVAHLKDLLTSEGLVLSGVSVGTSGQDGKGAQEQRHRPDARQVIMTTTQAVATQSRPQANPSVGRAVDLFV